MKLNQFSVIGYVMLNFRFPDYERRDVFYDIVNSKPEYKNKHSTCYFNKCNKMLLVICPVPVKGEFVSMYNHFGITNPVEGFEYDFKEIK